MNLFDDPPISRTDDDGIKRLHAAERRKIRARGLIRGGTHPATFKPLAHPGHTCGDCGHRRPIDTNDRCELTAGRASRINLDPAWPACTDWTPNT